MSTGVIFWVVVVGAVAFAAAIGLAVALLPPHGGEDEIRPA
ncbi:MAG TPA: hypothetical protein VG073_07845 [Gaiellaceae bacterium]|jgi:hypothetical protein|nr:hypothetical protein [Gaiellaceae bacterium]